MCAARADASGVRVAARREGGALRGQLPSAGAARLEPRAAHHRSPLSDRHYPAILCAAPVARPSTAQETLVVSVLRTWSSLH